MSKPKPKCFYCNELAGSSYLIFSNKKEERICCNKCNEKIKEKKLNTSLIIMEIL